jgi:nucleoside-diphosphate-sugar epimerase
MQGRRVLVAGGTGLVGANLTRRLVALGADVTASFHARPPLSAHYTRFDFTDFEDCLRATRDRDLVFIAAVQASGVQGMKDSPTAPILPNLQIQAGLMEACRLNRVRTVVWVSSSTVYQEASFPLQESDLDWNAAPYALYQGVGWMYRYLEQLSGLYRDQAKMEIGIVRTTSIYGPHDEFADGKAHVLPSLMKRALAKEDPFVVWGGPDTVRDFIYVDDLIDAMLRMVEQGCSDEPLNVCSNHPITIAQAVNAILDVTGHRPRVLYDASKPTAIPYRALDMSRYERRYGALPGTPLAVGLAKTLAWYREQTR